MSNEAQNMSPPPIPPPSAPDAPAAPAVASAAKPPPPRLPEAIRQDYTNACAELGQLTYQIELLTSNKQALLQRIDGFNREAQAAAK